MQFNIHAKNATGRSGDIFTIEASNQDAADIIAAENLPEGWTVTVTPVVVE